MKNLYITKQRFLEWYYEDGEGTTEYESLRLELAEKVIERLKEGNSATITTEEIFNDMCNQKAIRLYFCVGYDEDTDRNDFELQDCGFEYTLTLID